MAKTAPRTAVKRGPQYPSAKVGSYRAPVDTMGMDEDMKATMGFKKAKPVKRRPK